MVTLIILLTAISFNSYGSYKVDITNYKGQKMSKDDFVTEADALAYIAKLKHKWGKDQRWQFRPCPKVEDVIETREVVDELDINRIEYHCKKNYSAIVSEDVEGEQRKAKRLKRLQDIEDLKEAFRNNTAKLKDIIQYIKLKEGL